MTIPNPDHEHFFRYTSGRWLWDEEQQLKDRYKAFDVAELQSLAAKAVRSDSCISITKLAEGGYNKVFRLIMDDGKRVLARIPNSNAGPAFYSTASEVATMELARDFLQIPVPRVFDWSAISNNTVGSEYIIMEEVSGIQLGLIWNQLSPDRKLSIMKEIVTIESKMLAMSFSQELPPNLKSEYTRNSVLGLPSTEAFGTRNARRCRSRGVLIKSFTIPKPISEATLISSAQNNPQIHLQLLEKYLKVAPAIIGIDPVLTRPILWHGDLYSSNLFIDDSYITAIIDWQGSWAGLLFLQSQPSPIVDYQGSILLQRPDNFDDLDPEQQAELKQNIFKSTLYQLYLLETKERNPLLAKAFHLDHGKTRRLSVEFAGNTWDDDIVSFREALINVERHWQELGIQGECPYHFTQDEIHSHFVDAEGWNEVQDFLNSIEGLVKRDGWTYPDTFDAAFNFFSELRERGLKNMPGEKKRAFDRQTRWARKQGDSRAYGHHNTSLIGASTTLYVVQPLM
ncbi:hypothetical protein N7491_001942 [Penicillium cf. griseofulvum]|nr:hypothetical protein N7491_001942 [Penicillium cf. griseofulvum]